ncbi:hypothetical protein PFTANZ_05832, partial [Plasmodium falciparum Tanzania (2000708)]
GGDGGADANKSAKHALDEFGQQVYEEKVQSDAETYKDALKGKLSQASILGETGAFHKTCDVVEEYYKRDENRKRYPCDKRSPVRFSDEYGGQCTYNRIKDNEKVDNKCGACAPYRRLHLCDYNLEKMGTKKIDNTHDLLLEVCMAAKYEGQSINTHYTIHEATYGDSASQLCTALARSFADIGDIIRGKDLYRGDKKKDQQEKAKLQQSLKDIFAKIHSDVMKTNKEVLKTRYKKDGDNFFQLREDWWTANRATIWEAITCEVKSGNNYFRRTCSNDTSDTNEKCRCSDKPNTDPPTYFDYVPQYLRWFEEWAEDFCRKRKYKLENAIQKCRGDNGNDKYCSGNGYNCKETIRAQEKLVEGDDCHKCSVACKPFVE